MIQQSKMPPTIGYLIPEFPGQTHSFFWREIQALEAYHGYRVRIFSTRPPPQKITHEWVAQAQVEYLFPPPAGTWLRLATGLARQAPRLLMQTDARALLHQPRHWGFVAMAQRLGARCRQTGITHLHVHSCANAALIAAFCERMFNLPYSLVLHGPLRDYGPHQDFKWRQAQFAFVITEKLRREMKKTLPDTAARIRVAPMGVDTDRFVPPTNPRTTAPDPFRWFCCARLNRVKGYETLLVALDRIARARPDLHWHLSIAGEDDSGGHGYRSILEARIAEHELGDRISLLGAVTQSRVLSELQAADGFVLASHAEPLGVAYMEAMACGLPTVGTDAGGVPELIENGRDGMLVPPKDADALATALIRVMTEPELRELLAQAGRARILRDFGARRSADALAAALHEIS
jgi:glycosyltransferase involved in cell wall biosynthesis